MIVRLPRPGLVQLGIVVVVLPHASGDAAEPISHGGLGLGLVGVIGLGDGRPETTWEVGCFVHAGIVPRLQMWGRRPSDRDAAAAVARCSPGVTLVLLVPPAREPHPQGPPAPPRLAVL